jgi:hypothetical protein
MTRTGERLDTDAPAVGVTFDLARAEAVMWSERIELALPCHPAEVHGQ